MQTISVLDHRSTSDEFDRDDLADLNNKIVVARRTIYSCAKLPDMATVVTTDIKLSRCDNQPWGFRLSGGVDFTFPLTVVRVTIGGLAHTIGLQAGDVIVRLNGEPISQLTHAQVYNKLISAGDDIVLSVIRTHEIARRQQGQ